MGYFSDEAKDFLARILRTRSEKTPIKEEKYTFRSRAVPDETFHVINFKGVEGLSTLYSFTINLVSENFELDMESILSMPVLFIFQRPDGKHMPFHGVLSEFQQLQQVHGYTFYRATMVPKLWWLTQSCHNQIFLNQSTPEIIETVLKDGGLTTMDYDLRLKEDYSRVYEYVCQYGESHYHFLCRWLEREGLYYYFELTSTGEKIVITDTQIGHASLPQGRTVRYSPPSGLAHAHRTEVLSSFNLTVKRLPTSVTLKDYNYNRPSLDLLVSSEVAPEGMGRVYHYGDNYESGEEGRRLARFRTEAFTCRQKVFKGQSTAPFLRPGFLFQVEDHYRQDFNTDYLTVEITHEGDQSAYLRSGLGLTRVLAEKKPFYKNSFTAIRADLQYRSEKKTEKPRINSVLPAKIDAEGDGQYAELDDQGRYKVILPFDLSGRDNGKASTWLRMLQPYGGADHGFHFPLHKGTEVLLNFLDGDPDRPVIAGVAPNPETPSPVRNSNQTMNIILTAGHNTLEMQDLAGRQRVLLATPHADSYLHLGSPAAKTEGDGDQGNDGDEMKLATEGAGSIVIGQYLKTETGSAPTPDSTAITEQTTDSAGTIEAGPPQTGDYYLTTAAKYDANVGTDHFLLVKGKKLEQVNGNDSLTVGGNFGQLIAGTSNLTVGGPATQSYGSTLTIMAKDSIKQVCEKDLAMEIFGNQFVTITGKDTRTMGHKADTVLGATETTRFGGFNVFTLGLASNMNVGAVSNINLGGISNVNIGLMFSLTLAAQLVYERAAAIKVGKMNVNTSRYKTDKLDFDMSTPKFLYHKGIGAMYDLAYYIFS